MEQAAAARVQEVTTGVKGGKKDFMTWLMNGIEASESIPMEEIKEEVILLITAGKRFFIISTYFTL